jgi:hypothetical protein
MDLAVACEEELSADESNRGEGSTFAILACLEERRRTQPDGKGRILVCDSSFPIHGTRIFN